MLRLEQITALLLAAGLAIPSYWFFWSMAGGGGYDQRKNPAIEKSEQATPSKPKTTTKAPPGP